MLRISENPLQCGPLEASPISDVAGGDASLPSIAFGFLDHADRKSGEIVFARA
mgnify:CR=1 FL=1